jgi:hypothetical protein
MTAKSFVDTNVVPYIIGKDVRKAEIGDKHSSRQRMRQRVHAEARIHARAGLRLRTHADGSDQSFVVRRSYCGSGGGGCDPVSAFALGRTHRCVSRCQPRMNMA